MNYRLIILIIFFLKLPSLLFSQIIQRNINWLPNNKEKISENQFEVLNFNNAIYENPSTLLPFYYEEFKMLPYNNNSNIKIITTDYEIIPDEQLKNVLNIDSIPFEIIYNTRVSYTKKQPYLELSFIPLRRNKLTGKIERLISFSFTKTENNISTKNIKSRTYSAHSVLKEGKWVKIKINQTGIYKLTYKQISELGFTTPENIKIYGNGGKALSVYNSEFRYDDLVENPIYIEKGPDDIFNMGDYILFYGKSPVNWSFNSIKNYFYHKLHPYTDDTYYFITDLGGISKNIQTLPVETNPITYNVNSFDDYAFHEIESVNLIKSGQLWLGEYFNNVLSTNFDFNFPNLITTEPILINSMVYGRSNVANSFTFSVNGNIIGAATLSQVQLSNLQTNYASNYLFSKSFNSTNSNLSVNLTYNKPAEGGEGWLDYIELNVRRKLTLVGNQMLFRDYKSVASGSYSLFNISTTVSNAAVWDVTNVVNPYIVPTNFNNDTLSFVAKTDSLHEYIVFDKNSYLVPTIIGEVANQDLHSIANVDLVILSHPDFLSQANSLAEFHTNNDNLNVLVITPDLIYNEFSSGSPDITAVKDFMKMLYDKAGTDTLKLPKYLLFYGDGSYDNRHNFASNTNFILTYESISSVSPTSSFTTDDYFGMLDDNEGDYIGKLDIGVGRLPVKNTSEAQAVLNKITNFYNPENFGDWKSHLTFIADDEDMNEHMNQSNDLTIYLDTNYSQYNIDKIFLDAFQQVTTPNGNRYPDVNTAITNRINKGTSLVNYTGHGNEIGLAHEQIITLADISTWTNFNKLPLFITATCEFSRYDDFARTSAGESVLLNQKGGAIAMFTTTRLVYSSSNFSLNTSFVKTLYKRNNGNYNKLGDIFRIAKNSTSTDYDVNKRNFSLLGDPAISLSSPKYIVLTDSINGVDANSANTTLHALQKYVIKGHIADFDSTLINNYNGTVFISIYDKPITISTLSNDGGAKFYFQLQSNLIYKGKATVTNSFFEFTFVVPKDIQYNIDFGKISYYAINGTNNDALGSKKIKIGGDATSTITDNAGPDVKLFMNDNNFVFGGITDENPFIYAELNDENGINTVGNGIGHDITAILDGNSSKTYVLNDYYEGNLNDYKSGIVKFPLNNLATGNHNIKFKVWDVFNNSKEAYTEFVVAEAQDLAISNIYNYPNPFTTHTEFYFDHNQVNSNLDVLIQVFTITGKLVKSIKTSINNNSFHSSPISWDGKDDFDDKLAKGVYIYKLTVKSSDGKQKTKFEKLVML